MLSHYVYSITPPKRAALSRTSDAELTFKTIYRTDPVSFEFEMISESPLLHCQHFPTFLLSKVYFVYIKGCMIKRLKTHDLKQNVCITYSFISAKSSRKSKEKITGNKYAALSIKGFY